MVCGNVMTVLILNLRNQNVKWIIYLKKKLHMCFPTFVIKICKSELLTNNLNITEKNMCGIYKVLEKMY